MEVLKKKLTARANLNTSLILASFIGFGCYHLHVVDSMRTDLQALKIDLADVQQSVGDYDYLLQPIINDFGATRVVILRLVNRSNITAASIINENLEVVKTISRYNQDKEANLNLIRPLRYYVDILPLILDHKPVTAYVNNLPEGDLKKILANRRLVFSVWVDLTDKNNNVVGMISAGWNDLDDIPKDDEIDHLSNYLRNIAKSVGKKISELPN